MFRELHPNIRARILIQFLSKVIGSMIFPFMAIYFSMEINSSIAGVLLMINVFAQFLAGMYGGASSGSYWSQEVNGHGGTA